MKGYLLAAAALIVVIIIGGIGIFLLMDNPQPDIEVSDTRAAIPYRTVYEIATFGKSEVHDPNMVFCVRVRSTLPDVKPADISFYIDSNSGSLPLVLDNEGTFELPLQSSLLEENPMLVTNQPKGTMSLDGCLRIIGNQETQIQEISYSALMMPATWMQRKLLSQSKTNSEEINAPKISGLKIRVKDSSNTPLIIRSSKGEIRLQPDEGGECFVPFKEVLLLENPMITYPGKNIETMEVVME